MQVNPTKRWYYGILPVFGWFAGHGCQLDVSFVGRDDRSVHPLRLLARQQLDQAGAGAPVGMLKAEHTPIVLVRLPIF